MDTRTILVTGANGQLSTELQRLDWPAGVRIVAIDVADLDLSDTASIEERVAAGHNERPFAAVINGAVYTAVDQAESDLVTAWAVNAMAPAAFSKACTEAGIPLTQVLTDYVFTGDKSGAWEVDDAVPLGVYGASKLGGELSVRTSGARDAIVRTAWVVSAHGNNFVKTMLRVVDDQRGSPTSVADLAHALQTITLRLIADADAPTGTFHFSNAGEVTWVGFAREIFCQSSMRGGAAAEVTSITTAEYPIPAKRPANSLLSHAAVEAAYGIHPRPW